MSDHLYVYDFLNSNFFSVFKRGTSLSSSKLYSLPRKSGEERDEGGGGGGVGGGRAGFFFSGMQHALLTLARASTLAPFLSKIRIMSV